MSVAIEADNVAKRYGRTPVLDGLTFVVPEGSIFGLIGPNGAGKTTTVKMMLNFLRASSGELRVLGKRSDRIAGRDFEKIGYVSENQELPLWMTTDYYLNYLKPFYSNWDNARAAALRRLFDLPLNRNFVTFPAACA